jgi:hypothetical protein
LVSRPRSSQYESCSGGVARSTWVAADRAGRSSASLSEQADRTNHAPLSLTQLSLLVVGHEVKMRDAHGDDDMNPDGVPDMREDLVAESILIAPRIRDHEEPLISIDRASSPQRADARALKRERPERGQT